jgi:prevent-host-death family protein
MANRSNIERVVNDVEQSGDPWLLTRDGAPVAVVVRADIWEELVRRVEETTDAGP